MALHPDILMCRARRIVHTGFTARLRAAQLVEKRYIRQSLERLS